MTNAEKYLKREIDMFDMVKELTDRVCTIDDFEYSRSFIEEEIRDWFTSTAKPILPPLTEDERAILRNIQLYTGNPVTIRRIGDGHLYISGGCGFIDFGEYNHLFQFIKNGEEYLIKELLKNDKC